MILKTTATLLMAITLPLHSLAAQDDPRRDTTGNLRCFDDADCAELENPDEPCTQFVCELETGNRGSCVPFETTCDNGDICDGVESCAPDGGCLPGTPLDCDDGDACNGIETCDGNNGCQAGSAPQCDDGLFCNGVETCVGTRGCIPGTNPCTNPQLPICNESEKRCEDTEINCFVLSFEVEDDFATPLVNGQGLSTPPEFGNLVAISTLPGNHLGAAVFDSSPTGANVGGPDSDLLVDSGNLLILQDASHPGQTVAGVFDTPDDAINGGTIRLDFLVPGGVSALSLVVVDFEELPVDFTLTDSSGRERTVEVPTGYTSDSQLDTLSLVSASTANGVTSIVETDSSFDPRAVVRLDANFRSSGAIDDILLCLNPECAGDDECADEDPCTIDTCDFESGDCSSVDDPDCCETTGDCAGEKTCNPTNNRCECDDTPGCCEIDDDCQQGRVCEPTGRCVCDTPECCEIDDDCPADRSCDLHTGNCICGDAADCCTNDGDCPDNKSCDTDTGMCVCGDDPNCCTVDVDCPEGEECDPVTDSCVCSNQPGCCESETDCAGNKTCDPSGRCVCDDQPGCCAVDQDCPTGQVCGPEGRCVCHNQPGCCETNEDCAGNRSCDATGSCLCDNEPGCCSSDSDCPPGKSCLPDGRCACASNVAECCEGDSDCGSGNTCDTETGACRCVDGPCNDGNSCTSNDTCSAGVCAGQFIPGCGGGSGSVDQDADGIRDGDDNCPGTANGPQLGTCEDGSKSCLFDSNCADGVACQKDQENGDDDEFGDVCDACPEDELNDRDGDGICENADGCPMDPEKAEPGACGCSVPDLDSDGDGTADCAEACPDNPDKDVAGACGCDTPDTDSDGDGIADCNDQCPQDGDKAEPGICGCGARDVDTDNDGQCDEPEGQGQPTEPQDGPQEEPPLPSAEFNGELPCGCGSSSPLLGMAFMLGLGAMKLRLRRRR